MAGPASPASDRTTPARPVSYTVAPSNGRARFSHSLVPRAADVKSIVTNRTNLGDISIILSRLVALAARWRGRRAHRLSEAGWTFGSDRQAPSAARPAVIAQGRHEDAAGERLGP